MKLEHFVVATELKTISTDAAEGVFEGYGSVFNNVDSYGDTIAKGAFKATLKEWKAKGKLPKMLLQHGGGGFFSSNADDMVPIGKWTEMREDDTGLYMKGRLFDTGTDRVKAVYTAMKEGELDGLSIGFQTRKFKMDEESGVRTLTDIQLWETSLVVFPANDAARVTAVKSDSELPSEREFERFLQRDAGLSARQAAVVIAKGYRQLQRGGSMPSEEACGELLALVKQRTAIFTGDQRHGRTDTR